MSLQAWNAPPGVMRITRFTGEEIAACSDPACLHFGEIIDVRYYYEEDTGASYSDPEECPYCGSQLVEPRKLPDWTGYCTNPRCDNQMWPIDGLMDAPHEHECEVCGGPLTPHEQLARYTDQLPEPRDLEEALA